MKEITLKLAVAFTAFLIGIIGTTFLYFSLSATALNAQQSLMVVAPVNSVPSADPLIEQNAKNAKLLNGTDKRKIDELLSPIGLGAGVGYQKNSDVLIKFVENDPARRPYTANKLIAEIKQPCEANEEYIHSDFARIQFASEI
jgi:hypothetical protein